MAEKIEAIVAQYGVPNAQNEVLTEQAAMQIFNQLKQQETMPLDGLGYYISDVRIEGDRKQGKIYATFKFE